MLCTRRRFQCTLYFDRISLSFRLDVFDSVIPFEILRATGSCLNQRLCSNRPTVISRERRTRQATELKRNTGVSSTILAARGYSICAPFSLRVPRFRTFHPKRTARDARRLVVRRIETRSRTPHEETIVPAKRFVKSVEQLNGARRGLFSSSQSSDAVSWSSRSDTNRRDSRTYGTRASRELSHRGISRVSRVKAASGMEQCRWKVGYYKCRPCCW